jgi:hypothetical protein
LKAAPERLVKTGYSLLEHNEKRVLASLLGFSKISSTWRSGVQPAIRLENSKGIIA